jgi:hypothetical protein
MFDDAFTGMKRIDGGWTATGKDGSTYYWWDLPAHGMMRPPITIPPTFEAGKSYRTREGTTAQLLNDHGNALSTPFRINVKGDVAWAYRDGSFSFFGKGDQMLPGAIEDEPKAEQRTGDGRGFIAPPEPVEDREYRSDLRHIHNRLNWQRERLEERLADQTKHNVELYKRVEALTAELTSHRVNTADALSATDEHIEALGTSLDVAIAEVRGRIDGIVLERDTGSTTISRSTFMSLLDKLGYEIGDYGRVKQKAAPFMSTAVDPPKRTIKGGWVNVYVRRPPGERETLNDSLVTFYVTRQAADAAAASNRIACIQIPDITEGEGL